MAEQQKSREYVYYNVDGSFVARVNRDTLDAEVYRRDGTHGPFVWVPYHGNPVEILTGGHEVSEEQALAFAKQQLGGGDAGVVRQSGPGEGTPPEG
jgi:hypothetical protein